MVERTKKRTEMGHMMAYKQYKLRHLASELRGRYVFSARSWHVACGVNMSSELDVHVAARADSVRRSRVQ